MAETSQQNAPVFSEGTGLSADDIYRLTGFKLIVILNEGTSLEDIDHLHERALTDPVTVSAFMTPDGELAYGLFVDRAAEAEAGEANFDPRMRYAQLSSSIIFEPKDVPFSDIAGLRLPNLEA